MPDGDKFERRLRGPGAGAPTDWRRKVARFQIVDALMRAAAHAVRGTFACPAFTKIRDSLCGALAAPFGCSDGGDARTAATRHWLEWNGFPARDRLAVAPETPGLPTIH